MIDFTTYISTKLREFHHTGYYAFSLNIFIFQKLLYWLLCCKLFVVDLFLRVCNFFGLSLRLCFVFGSRVCPFLFVCFRFRPDLGSNFSGTWPRPMSERAKRECVVGHLWALARFASSQARSAEMGCGGSKAADDAPSGASPLLPTEGGKGGSGGAFQDAAAGRRSIVHKSQELEGEFTEDAPFDDAMIGTVTRHGIAPARGAGGSKAKINQDRGVVCWPFNGSHNQALLCVFDGHGMQGERISDFCAMEVPKRLEGDRDLLASDPNKCLSKNVRAPLSSSRLPP